MQVERLWVLRKVAGKEGVIVADDGTRRQRSNADILRLFRLDPAQDVLFRRRLVWLQGMALQPRAYVQFRAALFGPIRLGGVWHEAPPSPWGDQMERDLLVALKWNILNLLNGIRGRR